MGLILIFIFLLTIVIFTIGFFIVIDKAFLDSLIVMISLLGLILNNLQKDYPKIENFTKCLTNKLISIIGCILIVLGVAWIFIFIFLKSIPYGSYNPTWLIIMGIFSLIVGAIIKRKEKDIEEKKGVPFAIYFFIILIIYVCFWFNDNGTKAVLDRIF